MVNVIATAKITLNETRQTVESVSAFSSPSADYYQTKQLKQALKNDLTPCIKAKIDELLKTSNGRDCFIQVLENKKVILLTGLNSSDREDITDIVNKNCKLKKAIEITADKIQSHIRWIFEKETKISSKKPSDNHETSRVYEANPKAVNSIEKAFKGFVKSIDKLFVAKLYQAKGADIAVLTLFVFIILATAISIFAPHIAFLHFVNLGSAYSHPVFGVLNIAVGLGIAAQSIKNIQKAIKNKNKEELILAIVSLFFSFAITATGATAVANFANDYLLKSLFTLCAGFSFSVGIYNLYQTQIFRKKLNNEKLKDFLRDQIEINKEEFNALDAKIEALPLEELKKELQKNLSKQEFEMIKNKQRLELHEFLFNIELQILQKRKIAKLEKILRSELTKKAIDFLKSSDAINKELEKEIFKELNRRTTADAFRIFATSLSIGAFGFTNLSTIQNINIQNLIYYSTLLTSKLSGFWLNYVPSWRNVPANNEEEKANPKTMYERMTKIAQKTASLHPQAAL